MSIQPRLKPALVGVGLSVLFVGVGVLGGKLIVEHTPAHLWRLRLFAILVVGFFSARLWTDGRRCVAMWCTHVTTMPRLVRQAVRRARRWALAGQVALCLFWLLQIVTGAWLLLWGRE